MVITHYLAMTSAELGQVSSPPRHTAWMACHFSPYSTGLSNIPRSLPEGSLLILNDRTPIHRHDPQRVLRELAEAADRLHCAGVLLDLQLPDVPETAALAALLSRELQRPIGVSKDYYTGTGAVFLPPVPPDVAAAEYLKSWQGHEVWLETALECISVKVTANGAVRTPGGHPSDLPRQSDPQLHSHYEIRLQEDSADFLIYRTREDIDALLEETGSLGVTTAVGLFQELGSKEA